MSHLRPLSRMVAAMHSIPDPALATRCAHRRLAPRFDPDAASALSAGAVRRRWPRDWGECPDCGEQVIVYASAEHFVAGDR